MPNRILRESILDSERVNSLSRDAELFYRRLMSVVDDFGRFDARPTVLRSRCFPLTVNNVREADISRWIAECETAGLIALYSVSGKDYGLFHNLGSPRAKSSKFPEPPADVERPARTCAQTRADVPSSYSSTSSYSGPGSSSGAGQPLGSDLTPEILANEWCHAYVGSGADNRNPLKIAAQFREWTTRGGVSLQALAAAIRAPDRERDEPPWDLKQRLAPKKKQVQRSQRGVRVGSVNDPLPEFIDQ